MCIRDRSNIVATPRNSKVVRIDWDKVADAERYNLEIRFAGETKIVGRGAVGRNFVFVFAPSGRDYEVRVQTICSDGSESAYSDWIPYSSPSSFVTEDNTSAESRNRQAEIIDIIIGEESIAEATIGSLTTYPNPVSGVLNVNYRTTTETAVLSVIHISGKKVAEQALGKLSLIHI